MCTFNDSLDPPDSDTLSTTGPGTPGTGIAQVDLEELE